MLRCIPNVLFVLGIRSETKRGEILKKRDEAFWKAFVVIYAVLTKILSY